MRGEAARRRDGSAECAHNAQHARYHTDTSSPCERQAAIGRCGARRRGAEVRVRCDGAGDARAQRKTKTYDAHQPPEPRHCYVFACSMRR